MSYAAWQTTSCYSNEPRHLNISRICDEAIGPIGQIPTGRPNDQVLTLTPRAKAPAQQRPRH